MSDKKLDDPWDHRLNEAAQDYNAPPVPPRNTMWATIEARRTVRRTQGRVISVPWWQSRKVLWPAAAVAVLALGIGIGRLTAPTEEPPVVAEKQPVTPATSHELPALVDAAAHSDQTPGMISDSRTVTTDDGVRERSEREFYRYAAAPVLGQAEVLLAQYRIGDTEGTNGHTFTARAARLLGETRLLLDSPAADDPQLQQLLDDLELVLARLVSFAAGENQDEKEWIDEKLQRRFLLTRLRAQIPAGSALANL